MTVQGWLNTTETTAKRTRHLVTGQVQIVISMMRRRENFYLVAKYFARVKIGLHAFAAQEFNLNEKVSSD